MWKFRSICFGEMGMVNRGEWEYWDGWDMWTRSIQAGAGMMITVVVGFLLMGSVEAGGLSAGVAKMDITDRQAGPVHDPLYVKALVLRGGDTTLAIITVDAVALGEIGRIGNEYLGTVRSCLKAELGIMPSNVLVNASHCHGVVCADVAELTVQAVKMAWESMVPVRVGAGKGSETRISENRRLRLKDGSEADVRHAYSTAPDEEVVGTGPVDPEIGVFRVDRKDGKTLAVVYNFACHPIMGVPGGANTADIVGFASGVIEDGLGGGAMAFFLQGCAGDINPVGYKAVDRPRDAEPLGNMLGLSTLKAVRAIETKEDDRLAVLNEAIQLPRGRLTERIAAMEAEEARLVGAFRGTSLNFKTFLALAVKYKLSPESPSHYSYAYLRERELAKGDLEALDAENRKNMEAYMENIRVMEELTRLQTNLALLRKHHADNVAAGKDTVEAELMGVRMGDFVLVTFPGELSAEIGLNIKKGSPHPLTFVAGCTNGYIYYAPTSEQLRNTGAAQEDCDCVLAPEWQESYEKKVGEMLEELK